MSLISLGTRTSFSHSAAYGHNGVIGRWRQYARTGHLGNILMRELVESESGYERNLQFTPLRTLPTVLTDREVIEYERLYKDNLGHRRTV